MRIVSLSPSSTELLFALGAGADVVGVTQHCDFPAESQHRERVGSWLSPHLTAIDALTPDLIVTTNFLPDAVQAYNGEGDLLHLEPSSLGGVLESILQLGWAVGRSYEAQRLVNVMQQEFERIRAQAPARQLRVYSEAWPNPPLHAGEWVPEVIELAGGKPVAGWGSQPSSLASIDALRKADPDVLVFHWCDAEQEFEARHILQRPGWDSLRATQANAIAYLPGNSLNRPGPRLVDAARQLQAVLHAHQRVS